jgi:hypothetical protein
MHNAIAILQNDPARAELLVSKVRSVSEAVFIVRTLPELQTLASQFPIPIGVLDLGLITFPEIVRLRHQLAWKSFALTARQTTSCGLTRWMRARWIVVSMMMGQPSAAQFSKPQSFSIEPHRKQGVDASVKNSPSHNERLVRSWAACQNRGRRG